MVARGAPLFAVEASEFVQGQNDLVTAAASPKTAQAQLRLDETNEKRQHELYLAKGGALKDWQQSQIDLATAQSNAQRPEIALAAVRNRLRILGKSDAEIAAIENGADARLDPVADVVAPIGGTVTQRQVGLGQNIQSVQSGASDPGLHDRRSVDGLAGRQRARGGRAADALRRRRWKCGCWPFPAASSRRRFPGWRRRSTPTRIGCRCAPMSKTPTAR